MLLVAMHLPQQPLSILAAMTNSNIVYKDTGLDRVGVRVVPYGSGDFDSLLRLVARGPVPAWASDVLPFCLVVQNDSGKPLWGITVRYSFVSQDDTTGAGTVMMVTLDPRGLGRGLEPGVKQLFCIDQEFATSLFYGRADEISPGEADRLGAYREKKQVEMSVDAVILPGGQVVGPDLSQTADYMNGAYDALRDVASAVHKLEKAPESELAAMLEEMAAVKKSPSEGYVFHKGRHAGALLKYLRVRGGEELAIEAARLVDILANIKFTRKEP